MTNYITSVGTQQVSVTIATGATTGTATITAVGSGAFIIWQGQNSTETAAEFNDVLARIEITNSTTITATRGASSATKTVTVNAVIIDGDTTNLIKSVQSGTISLSTIQSSNTASISAVTNNNTAVVFLGISDSTSIASIKATTGVVSLSGTTVTATKNTTGAATVHGFCVIEFQGAVLNQAVQNVAYNASLNASSVTQTITSVTTGNTFLAFGGWDDNITTNSNTGRLYLSLTNGTTVTAAWNTAATATRAFNCSVVEFVAGVLNQSVQRGTIALAAATSNTATITSSVAANGFVNWLNNSSSQVTTLVPNVIDYKITQTNATTLTMTVNATATGTGSYEVVEFPAFSSATTTAGFNHYYSRFIGRIDGFGGSV